MMGNSITIRASKSLKEEIEKIKAAIEKERMQYISFLEATEEVAKKLRRFQRQRYC
jgi:hypothetical protein